MADLFQALAHPDRRAILDALFERDGQSLSEIAAAFAVTRFAVMKQLKILEAAHLVTSRRVGREKRHFLNPVPIQIVGERWISRYAAPFAGAMTTLKRQAEGKQMNGPEHIYEVYINAAAQSVWDLLTDDRKTPLYQQSGMTSRTEWRPGGTIEFLAGDRAVIVGEILEFSPPSRLVTSFSARWSPEVSADPPSRVTWDIQPLGEDVCKLTLTHDNFGGSTMTSRQVQGGWPKTLSRLKTLAETGKTFPIDES